MAFTRINPESEVQVNSVILDKNLTNLPKDIIADTDPNTYKLAAQDFLSMDSQSFSKKYPELEKPSKMYQEVEKQVHLGKSASAAMPTREWGGQTETEFVRSAVKAKLAVEIAQAEFPIVNKVKSHDMAEAFSHANTAEERLAAIEKFPQLDQAFQHSDAMKKIAHIMPNSVAESIAKGEVPQITPDLIKALEIVDQRNQMSLGR